MGAQASTHFPLPGTVALEPFLATALTTVCRTLMTYLLSVLEDVETPLRLLGAALFAFLFVRALRTAEAPPVRSARWLLARVGLAAALAPVPGGGAQLPREPLGNLLARASSSPSSCTRAPRRCGCTGPPSPRPRSSSSAARAASRCPRPISSERTGRPAFNASLHGGVPEDYLAFLRYMASLDKLPKLLIVPMSVELVRPNLPTGFEPHNPAERPTWNESPATCWRACAGC